MATITANKPATTYAQVIYSNFDAGVYREFVAHEFGMFFLAGGSIETANRAMRHAKALARIASIPLDMIVADLKDDAAELFDHD